MKNQVIEDLIVDVKRRMSGAIASFHHNLSGLRSGRASATLLEPIKVDVYGDFLPISQLGTVSAPESRMLAIQVWDKSNVKSIEKAIIESGLGLNPISEGQTLRIPIPNLNEERRKDLSKKAAEYCEQSKVSLRNIRRDIFDDLKKMEKAKSISEDQHKYYNKEVQKVVDDYIAQAETLLLKKTKEIMSI